MGKIITVASHKGGVGKTTTALNIGFSLSRFGQKVLLVDSDPQGGMTIASNLKKRTTLGMVSLLRNDVKPQEVVIPTRDGKMGVLGSGISEPEDVFLFEREARKGTLGKMITAISEGYDYTFIDAPAGVSGVTAALLGISSSVLVPISCQILAVRTLPVFLKLLQKIRRKVNPGLLLEGVVVTMIDDGEAGAEIFREIEENFPPSVLFGNMIPFDESFEIASMKSLPVGLLPGGEEAAQAYMDLAVEFKTREMNLNKKGTRDEDAEGLF
ncbi:ParA family protein [Desulfonema ishimotonii]|uniref:ParA family protein n=1 Tax=Desulfonema ishimotonii TaxID=45657 RepID=A0A401FVX9_9BACT|nr:ParA family protein [Desulfonema ishimotonii]GBC61118.1 ParA family protein [Desulfonema ishimotonii]